MEGLAMLTTTSPHTEEVDQAFGDQCERSGLVAGRLALLGEMTGGIVHDFRNILAVIEVGARMAADNAANPLALKSCLDAIHDVAVRGVIMTSRLLTFASEEQSQVRIESVHELIRGLLIPLEYAAGPDVRIEVDLEEPESDIRLESSSFCAALLNLIINARDAMPAGGVVKITTKTITRDPAEAWPHRYFCVRVKDSGQGMTRDVRQRIFDRYFTTKGARGTGLGIPQICSFVHRVGGFVRVDSRPGAGTSFDLCFPISEGTEDDRVQPAQIELAGH